MRAALNDTMISGAEEPIATTVSPMTVRDPEDFSELAGPLGEPVRRPHQDNKSDQIATVNKNIRASLCGARNQRCWPRKSEANGLQVHAAVMR